jgi:hypothetical protein
MKVKILNIEPLDTVDIHKISYFLEYPGRDKVTSFGSAKELAKLHKGFVLEIDVLKRRNLDFDATESLIHDSGWILDDNDRSEFYFYLSASPKDSLNCKEGNETAFRIDQLIGCDTFPPARYCIFQNGFLDGISGQTKAFITSTLIREVSEADKKYLAENIKD